jgi:hypothetical protein
MKTFLAHKQQRFFSPETHSTQKKPYVICLKLNFEQKAQKTPKTKSFGFFQPCFIFILYFTEIADKETSGSFCTLLVLIPLRVRESAIPILIDIELL